MKSGCEGCKLGQSPTFVLCVTASKFQSKAFKNLLLQKPLKYQKTNPLKLYCLLHSSSAFSSSLRALAKVTLI